MPRQRGPVYQFERVPPDLWRRAKARAALEGRSIREVFLAFLQTYASGIATPNDDAKTIAPPQSSATEEPRPLEALTKRDQSVPPCRSLVISLPDPELGF